MGTKFEYKGAIYDVPGRPKREWKWMLDKDTYCVAGDILCLAQCLGCVYSRQQGEGVRKAFYYECFPEEKSAERSHCEECADYKPKEERPKLTQEVFERLDCPGWAKWAAVDKDGKAAWYEEKPKNDWDQWYRHGSDRFEWIEGKFDASDWQHSLIERKTVVKRGTYKIIKEKSTPELEYTINQRIACGWIPKGSVGFDSSTGWYMQAMIKKED